MESLVLQPWTTIHMTAPQVTSFTQDDKDWLDVGPYTDASFWVDISDVVVPNVSGFSATVTLVLETSPTDDDAYFMPVAQPITLGVSNQISGASVYNLYITSQSMFVSGLRTATNVALATVPLAKFLRWQLQISGSLESTANAWGATFRIRVAATKRFNFSPVEIPGCILWTRGDMGITLGSGSSGTGVSNWQDDSGLGNSFAQGTATDQPVFAAAGVSGLPCIEGNGSSAVMTTGGYNWGTDITMFSVVTPFEATQTANARILETTWRTSFFLGFDTLGTSFQWIVATPGSPYGSCIAPSTIVEGGVYLVVGTFSSATMVGTLYVYGAPAVASATSVNFLTMPTPGSLPLYALAGAAGAGWNFDGALAEAIVYSRALSSSELALVNRYLGARYGIASVP